MQREADVAHGAQRRRAPERPAARTRILAHEVLDFEQRRPRDPRHPPRLVRRGPEQGARVGMAHLAQHRLRGTGLDHAPLGHDRETVGGLRDDGEVVRDEDQAHAVLVDEPPQQDEDRRLRRDVERGRRLVGDQQLRAQRDGHGDADALALAARQFVRIARGGDVREADAVERRAGDRARLGARGGAVDADRLRDLVADRLKRVQRGHRLLKDHADVATADRAHFRFGAREQVDAFEQDAPRRHRPRGQQADDAERRHRLARAALADDAENFAGAEPERYRAQRRRAVNGDGEVLDGEQGHPRGATGRGKLGEAR